ncbi:polysaccharide pyruvyl transferase family protein [Luteimonas terrae]|uniref:Polysaccharide pyruvyl transferase WcaK-like protein n=1 Tax=Luteimonas terrae TaxID=1530191 RepID=A0ABU1Y1M7_9GAMM|nr:polysaccharide pyruvyl transferase family protein [Luteimonas terrae]MDR7194360.1 polysaccharide pyruvyl transferase WcaK-like protein [Luteimonas terrae]
MKSYSIIAATAYGNRGAEAMLETVVGRLKAEDPQLVFHVFSYYPDDDRRLISAPNVHLHSSTPLALVAWLLPWAVLFGVLRLVLGRRILALAPASIRALGRSTVLVDLAGVAFIDGREKFLPFNFLTLLPAWLLGTPVVKMPQAVGPFEKPLNRFAARLALSRCTMVWARGGRTREHLDHSGFKGLRYRQGDDIAFNYKIEYSLTREGEAPIHKLLETLATDRRGDGVRGVIGVCPSSVVAVQARQRGDSYESVLVEVVADLSRNGFLVVLFPNATRENDGDAERNNDLPLIRRILAGTDALALPISPIACTFDINAAGIKRIIAELDVALVSRFHAMVGALSLGVPCAVLGWSHKYAEVMARFGQESEVMDYKQLSAEELRDRVVRVFEHRVEIRDCILASLPEVQASADLPVAALLTEDLGASLA